MFSEGRFEQVLILTFNADLEFYERVLRRHFGSFRNQIVLADARLVRDAIAGQSSGGGLRHLNRSWLVGPIRNHHAAHAKAILLAAPERGLLLAGSGNLSISGYAGAGECFTPFHWSPDAPEDLVAFTAVKDLVDRLGTSGRLDSATRERLAVFWNAYDWWHHPPANGPLRHNLDTPLGEQLITALEGERVEELTVIAPFHDQRCAALDQLASRLKPKSLRVLVQPGHCSVDSEHLARVLQLHGGQAHTITAAGQHAGSYLHAKIILAKTRRRAVCLTGSANCSLVALWRPHPNANIELGCLTIGPRTAFDHLLDGGVVTISNAVDPTSLDVHVHDDPDAVPSAPPIEIIDLQWRAPRLTAVLSVEVADTDAVSLELDGEATSADVTTVERNDGATRLTFEITDPALVAQLDGVAVVSITVDGVGTAIGVPYQLERLAEQDKRRVDVERLRHAARLEIEDPELEQALAALEEILIGDNVARWTHDRAASGDEPSDDAGLAWSDIDWAAVRRQPRAAAYGQLTSLGVPGSDLAAYLDALSQAVREMIEPELAPSTSPTGADTAHTEDDLDDDQAVASGLEGADIDDVLDETEDDQPRRRQSIAARNRRLIRNFVRRNLHALEQPTFREGAGPGIVILNVIILNWVCWWVATKDEDSPGELTEERLRLWRLLWGDAAGGEAGYLSELSDEHKALVLDRFEEQHVEVVTVASLLDVWTYIPSVTTPEYRQLRGILRAAVSSPCWQVAGSHVAAAAKLMNTRPTTVHVVDGQTVADTLWTTACTSLGDSDTSTAIGEALHIPPSSVQLLDELVVVDDTRNKRVVRQATIQISELSDQQVHAAFAAWQGADEREHYRLKWDTGVALYRRLDQSGWIHRHADDITTELGDIPATRAPWRIQLDLLCDTIPAVGQVA
jgi:hypothetical protein